MLNINDNLSFKANMITSLKGRSNVMDKVTKSFTQKSAGIKGSLVIKRGKSEFKGSLVCTLGRVKDSPEFYIANYEQFLSLPPENVTQQEVDTLAERLVKIMQILKKEHTFNKKNEILNKTLQEVKSVLKTNEKKLQLLMMSTSKKASPFISIYETLVQSHKNRIDNLLLQKQILKRNLVQDTQKIAGEQDTVLNEYAQILNDVM